MYFNQAYPTVCGCYYFSTKVSAGGTTDKKLAQKIAVYFSSCDESGMIMNTCTHSNGTTYPAVYCPWTPSSWVSNFISCLHQSFVCWEGLSLWEQQTKNRLLEKFIKSTNYNIYRALYLTQYLYLYNNNFFRIFLLHFSNFQNIIIFLCFYKRFTRDFVHLL